MGGRILYGFTVFLSAFLLFQVQPVLGKYILPWFGSAPGVWAVCLVFFQVVLLGGYTYAHFVVSRMRPRRQAVVHVVLLVAALATLPITPSPAWKPDAGDAPTGRILLVLVTSVGLPYLLLSATGPLLQGWFARLHPRRSVYRLYALSNFGSLLGLLSYPLWFERKFRLQEQTGLWSIGYALFAVLCAGCAWSFSRVPTPTVVTAALRPAASPRSYGRVDVLLWFLLPACASALLLASTNQLCLDVAVIPFLWVVPLCVYLLSFILTFDHERWYVRPAFCALLPFAIGMAVWLMDEGVDGDLMAQLIGYPAVLFVLCMCCHGELARLKPAPEQLTFFFLVVSMGGAAGGLSVALGAPRVFDGFHEYPLLLMITFVLVLFAVGRQAVRGPAWRLRPRTTWWTPWGPARRALAAGVLRNLLWVAAAVPLILGTFLAFQKGTWLEEKHDEDDIAELDAWLDPMRVWMVVPPLVAWVLVEVARRRRGPRMGWRTAGLWAGAIVGGLGLGAAITAAGWMLAKEPDNVIERGRNFYGVLSIREFSPGSEWHDYTLQHGRITHGFQFLRHPAWPTTYYGPQTGVGLSVALHRAREEAGRAFRIGVVGLGAGTMAAYANAEIDRHAIADEFYAQARHGPPRDYLRFYEINPLVLDYARRRFTYLADAESRGADVDVFLGDARLVMERQLSEGQSQRFDVLAIDAFSSDAIPIHLLTKESFEIYVRHLAPMGVLAVHVTNRFIDLVPVVRRLGQALDMEILHVESDGDDGRGVYTCDWVLLTRNRRIQIAVRAEARILELDPPGPLWTDDYSSVWDQVRFAGDDEE